MTQTTKNIKAKNKSFSPPVDVSMRELQPKTLSRSVLWFKWASVTQSLFDFWHLRSSDNDGEPKNWPRRVSGFPASFKNKILMKILIPVHWKVHLIIKLIISISFVAINLHHSHTSMGSLLFVRSVYETSLSSYLP